MGERLKECVQNAPLTSLHEVTFLGTYPILNRTDHNDHDPSTMGAETQSISRPPSSRSESTLRSVNEAMEDKSGLPELKDQDLTTATDDVEKASSPPSPPLQKPAGIPPPPNGGLVAWLHVLGGFCLFFNSWGILNTFGVYQTYYESGALFQESSSTISWIGAMQAYMVLFVGFLTGPIFDRGHFRPLLAIGSFLIVFGHMMLSISDKYYQVLLSQGFCVGIGAGCLFLPCVAILPTYFSTRIGLAVGLAAAGSSMGGVIYPIAFYKLIDEVGFGWATRIIGFIALGTLVIPNVVMKIRFSPPKARKLVDLSAFTDPKFMFFVIGTAIGFIGLYVIFFFISYYAGEQRITDSAMSFYIVPILNSASIFGRTLPNALSDKTGPINLIAPGAFIVGILIFSMIAVTTEAAIIIIAILVGFFSGVFIALPPVCVVALTDDKSKIGTRIGMAFGIIGFGVLAGGPGGGAILGDTVGNLDWTATWAYGGTTSIVAGFFFVVLRVWKAGWQLKMKV